MVACLDNGAARRLFLDRHALLEQPAGPAKGEDLLALIGRLGFVQVDSIATVERAHHMILFARRPAFRPGHLAPLLERDRHLFEHWTHDAAVIPTEFYPHWRLRFARDAEKLRGQWQSARREGFERRFDTVLQRIRDHGPVSSADVGADEARSKGGWWDWHPSKTALEYLWRSGELSVTRREAFRKVYDLTERVIPEGPRSAVPHPPDCIDWLCAGALDRLGFATPGEIAAFWDIVTVDEAKGWARAALAERRVEEVDIAGADGRPRRALARSGTLAEAHALPDAPGRIRVLSPFDPALRDRKRAERLFGFHYRIEIFVPAPKRRYGYYVFPLLEGDRLVGRIDMKTDRGADALKVTALWPERGLRWGRGRQARLEAELDRVARFAGLSEVRWQDGWLRDAE
ncbi:winged helix-turn-helix domain-containing protein [Aestuariicoccus sp. MJ-SS9]|uniref:winged helix-turn-helix domain-containing protein n=1 Tax=Aestuariicoccus sp. MJ-SS9 TaxID=3079855 RepID=UPI002912E4D8|nr:crosslink repair DNA glycosylase YcaQ family protein [Aestuariicoccus sp. MJ-SS9]MDU8913796.1 crosslink repair DNA glycosylase YcaQ family protein [Aestuariicoccus sp. MJ-SS9]